MGRARGPSGDLYSTRALSKFIHALSGRTAPVVVDLGPAVGANVTFLGEQLGCKLHVEDLLSDPESWKPSPAEGDGETDVAPTESWTLSMQAGSVDGVICWDVIDYLDDVAAKTLAAEVTRVLKPQGVVFLRHRAEKRALVESIQYEIIDETTLRHRTARGVRAAPRIWQSRAVTKMFDRLVIHDSFLLTSRMREVVLWKPPATIRVD